MDPKEVNIELEKRFREEEVKSSPLIQEDEASKANLELDQLMHDDEKNERSGLFYMNNNISAIKINKKMP